ncbi:MAG: hypothetical protein ACRERD_23655 [Candidatus Binatia bacterium]
MARVGERAVIRGEAAGQALGRKDGGYPSQNRPLPQKRTEQEGDECVVDQRSFQQDDLLPIGTFMALFLHLHKMPYAASQEHPLFKAFE